MIQITLIGILFTAALGYLIWTIRKQFVAKNFCAKGCGCSKIDLDKIEKELSASKK